MSQYLVDTHVWLWLNTAPSRLPATLLQELSNPAAVRLLSVASAWEVAIKHQRGKLPLPVEPATYLPDRLRRTATRIVPIELDHVLAADALPRHHADPFDRILVAQAQQLAVPLITADPVIERYDVETIRC